ncbi:hypothetical protein [uncultured Dokdonia sp.]|uniref:hypothetical protein n=1 Tax=uncultured Dokdonia sp. TaxID=575653 RepID=UPI0026301D84|nr:hypothetical protein [uncultured Dokdonia sp.]
MLIVLLKIIALASLLAIFYQDQKDRMVYWWFFLIGAVGFSILHIQEVGWLQFGIHCAFNIGLVSTILVVLMLYIRIRFQTFRLQNVLGLGDILLFYALALSFATLSFVTLFVFGLLFSLVLHLVFKNKHQYTLSRKRINSESSSQEITVPLAGYLSLFFAGVLLVHWLGFYENLYVI